jgi:hypothetical protein
MEKQIYECIDCNYTTNKRGNYNRHIKTKKHLEICNLFNDFSCLHCDYITNRKNNLIRHVNKHHKNEKSVQKKQEKPQKNMIDLSSLELNLQKILKEQENIKKLIPKNTGNTIINNKLSINVYLNTECKEAMSIQDFLKQMNLSLDDLYYTKQKGYVEGISNVFVKKLAHLDPKERPIHCSDKKRLHFYVKNTDAWEKDDNNKNINKAIGNVQRKQIEMLYHWELNHPGWEKNEKLFNERSILAKSVYGSIKDVDRQKDNKAIKKKISEKIDLDINVLVDK